MNILNTLLSFLFALLTAMILIFGSIVFFCTLLFSIRVTLTLGGTKIVTKFSKAGMVTEFYFYSPSTKPIVTKYLKISWKKQTLTVISLKVDPEDNSWHANAKVQIRDDGLQDVSLDEQSYVLTCTHLNDSCILITYNNQNGLSVQNLQLSDTVQVLIQTFSCTSQKAVDVRSTDTSENSKTKEKAEAYPSQKV